MSTRFLLLWVTLAGLLSDTFAQKTFNTSGTSGQLCGRAGSHCLSTAKCTCKRKGTCRCNPPLYGQGKLGCFRHGDAVAVLQPGPDLKTFNHDNLNIATPCRYKVIHYSMASFNGMRASAEVYAKNALNIKGEYYVKNVLVIISVMAETSVGKHSILLEGNATGGNYTFVSTEMEDTMIQSSQQLHMDVTGFLISVSVDNINNFLTARADGVGLTVRFRPTETGEVQHMIPGVTMVIDKEVLHAVKFLHGTLSSSPHGVHASKQAHSLGLDLQKYAHYTAILNTPALIMDDRTCLDTAVVFKNICGNDKIRVRLLQTCSSLYSDKQFLSCIYNKRQADKRVTGHRLLFRYCAQSFCSGLVNVCQAMLQIIGETQCPLPAALRDFQCSPDNLRVH